MTIAELRQKPIGVLETRNFIIKAHGYESTEYYSLVKLQENTYSVGFSENGEYCSSAVGEETMVQLLNDKELSDDVALDIYFSSPQLACWLD